MSCHDENGQLGQLVAPRRNRYFYGKLMDVFHFEMEQCYMNRKRWLLNRLSLGQGVLCGLDVMSHDDQVCVTPGVAIDGLGREIIAPVQMCIDPWDLTDECGGVKQHLSKETGHKVYICLGYNECLTDYAPVLVTDCNTKEDCAASTTVETFKILVIEGTPPLPGHDICKALEGKPGMSIAERRAQLCSMLFGPCDSPKGEICVVLATVELLAGGAVGAIDNCTYRTVLYSNDMLLDMILCLAAKIDECCGNQPMIKVEQVQFLDKNGNVVAELQNPAAHLHVPSKDPVDSIKVTFSQPVDVTTVTAGGMNTDPQTFSFLVQDDKSEYVPGSIQQTANPNEVVFVIDEKLFAFAKGDYVMTLYGDPSSLRPAISDTTGHRLDGEPSQLPSGDDNEGGDFVVKFSVD